MVLKVNPNNIVLYRIIHIGNIDHILSNGILNRNHAKRDPNYINIGNNQLIKDRNNYPIPLAEPGGMLGDYVPFYFGPLSPMLYNIITGWNNVTKRPQCDIIYLCCKLMDVIKSCPDWCFTDGHAKMRFTEFFNKLEDLDRIDWNIVNERYWRNTDDDTDRMRRKMAEFLVKSEVPINCINNIVVLNEDKKQHLLATLKTAGANIPVYINPGNNYYYI